MHKNAFSKCLQIFTHLYQYLDINTIKQKSVSYANLFDFNELYKILLPIYICKSLIVIECFCWRFRRIERDNVTQN